MLQSRITKKLMLFIVCITIHNTTILGMGDDDEGMGELLQSFGSLFQVGLKFLGENTKEFRKELGTMAQQAVYATGRGAALLGETGLEGIKYVGKGIDAGIKKAREDIDKRIDALTRQLDSLPAPGSLEDNQGVQQQRIRLQRQLDDCRAKKDRITELMMNAFRAPLNWIDKAQEANKEIAIAETKAKEDAKANLEFNKWRFEQLREEFANPKRMLQAGGWILLGSGTFFVCRYGLELAFEELRYLIHNPSLAQETSIISPMQRFNNWFWQIKLDRVKLADVVLEEKLARRIAILAQSVRNAHRNGANFSNILFYGPPGTGKTMLGKSLAHYSHLPWIYFAASSFNKFSLKEALQKITELIEFAKNYGEPIVIVIDECEVLFANRDKQLSEDTRKILTAFLSYTGAPSRDFIIVGLTNRPQDFDEASLSRFGVRIKIDIPGVEEQRRMLAHYIHKYLYSKEAYKPQQPTMIQWIFGKKVRQPKPPIVDEDAFDEPMIEWILKNIPTFVGRDIEQLALAWQRYADCATNRHLTRAAVQEVLQEQVAQQHLSDSLVAAEKPTATLTPAPPLAEAMLG